MRAWGLVSQNRLVGGGGLIVLCLCLGPRTAFQGEGGLGKSPW